MQPLQVYLLFSISAGWNLAVDEFFKNSDKSSVRKKVAGFSSYSVTSVVEFCGRESTGSRFQQKNQ
jgi:hypothetical protein